MGYLSSYLRTGKVQSEDLSFLLLFRIQEAVNSRSCYWTPRELMLLVEKD